MLSGRRIILGIAGGIAAYKAAEMARSLVKLHGDVQVVMTDNACRFLTPLTLRTLTGRAVARKLFSDPESPLPHISLAQWAELILVLPATADLIARCAAGRANDLLSAIILDTSAPVVWAPAMNSRMWENPITQANVERLRQIGHHWVLPSEGELACGETGSGRLAPLDQVQTAVRNLLIPSPSLSRRRILITAGPTREPWDAVRFLSNRSSGKMGYALAKESLLRGAEVTLISGPVSLTAPAGVRFVPVTTASDMHQAAMATFPHADVVIAAAAVADFRPSSPVAGKLKKSREPQSLSLVPNPDILLEMGEKKQGQVLVGFAAEAQDPVAGAKAKRAAKHLDLVIANYAGGEQDAFDSDQVHAYIVDAQDRVEELPRQSKSAVAKIILDRVETLIAHRQV